VLQDKCVAHIRRRQLDDGGWNIYEGGPSDVNASVKAYFALKLAGICRRTPGCARPAPASALGGIPYMNTYAKLYLALLGQVPVALPADDPRRDHLLPNWCFFNVYEMSSWSRAMLMPLALLNHHKPTRSLPAEFHLHELYPPAASSSSSGVDKDERFFTWRNFFLRCDRS
jgi:squalene-hopene/tetraprenyl-beta-curcumene cyclase